MASITIRNVPDDVHRALRVRAAEHGRSAEAEIRAILEHAVKPEKRVRVGDALAALGRKVGLTDAEVELIETARSRVPMGPKFGTSRQAFSIQNRIVNAYDSSEDVERLIRRPT